MRTDLSKNPIASPQLAQVFCSAMTGTLARAPDVLSQRFEQVWTEASDPAAPPSAPTHRFPAPRKPGCVESLGGVERPRGALRCLPAERPAEHPLASESNKGQPVVRQARSEL